MADVVALPIPHIRPPPTPKLWMISSTTMLTWRIIFSVVVDAVYSNISLFALFILPFLFFPLPPSLVCNLAYEAPSTDLFSLISLFCSCACNAFNCSAKEILDKSLVSSRENILD